jgi:hypothetical protein
VSVFIDPRLPGLKEIDEPTRQQKRRVTGRRTSCSMCCELLDADDCCFADGKDAHRTCAEGWNNELLGALEILRRQDEEQLAAVAEERKSIARESRGGEWTTATATLDA